MTETSRELVKYSSRINQTYGGRHFRTVIGSNNYFLHVYKYVYLNPVKAGLASRAEEYPFSTLHGLLGQSRLVIPVEEDLTLFSDVEGTLDWINQPPSENNWETIRKTLRRKEFILPKQNRKVHELETTAL
jgi:hypothetical protein